MYLYNLSQTQYKYNLSQNLPPFGIITPFTIISYKFNISISLQSSQMKQLLPISKKSKQDSRKNSLKPLVLAQPENQQHNFIFQQNSENDDDHIDDLDNNQPSQTQILFYAQNLGIKLPQEKDLLYIAKQCLNADMPPNWHCQTDGQGQIIYINQITGQIKFQHPSDQAFRQKVIIQRKKKIQNLMKAAPKSNKPKSKTSFVENVFKQKPEAVEVEQKNYKPIEQKKSLSVVINQGLNNIDARERKQNIKDNPGKNTLISQTLPKLDLRKSNQKLKSSVSKQKIESHVNLSSFHKKPNSELLLQKRKQIQQKMQKKYKQKINEEQKKFIQKLKEMKQREQKIKNTDPQQLKQIIGENTLERKRKQTQMKLMMQHATNIDRKRLQAQKEYRKQLLFLSSKYQIDQLFTEMAECRKFINREKKQSQKPQYFEQMGQNIRVINQIQIQKAISEIQRESRTIMHQILNKILSQQTTNKIDWQKQQKITNQFNEALNKIISKNTKQERDIPQLDNRKQPQEKIMKESLQLYQQMTNLKKKLKQLQEQNSTHRSNLSEKQSRLVDLLQNRASSSARSSQS